MTEKLAIDGGPATRSEPFPRWPLLGPEDVSAVAEVLDSGKLTQLSGRSVADFERAFATWHGAEHCVATSSGTTAIHTALIALGIGAGDEVIVPAHTFIASTTPVLHQGATPVFADVDERTFCISPESVRERLTDRTKAIIAVHLNGHPADLDALLEIARPRGIAVIEDAAQAHGATYKGRKAGTIGNAGCFSFWEDKIITTGGEGGAIIAADDALIERMRRIRHHGEGPVEGERAYYHLDLGYNYRMTSMQAATGLVQLHKLDEYLIARRRNAAHLTAQLAQIPHIEPPFVADYAVHSYYKYICRLRPASGPSTRLRTGIDIARFVAAVVAEGLPVSRRYPTPLPQQPVFRDAGPGAVACPVAERLSGELFTLLVHPTASTSDMDDYVAAIGKVVAALAS
jgi:perosamine synthetase